MNINYAPIIGLLVCLITGLCDSSAAEVFFPKFREGPSRHQIIRAKDGTAIDLVFSENSNVRAVNDLEALDVRIKRSNGYGGANRIILFGEIDRKNNFKLIEWYIICPYLDDRPKDDIPPREAVWSKAVTDADFSKILVSPIQNGKEVTRDYIIKDNDYSRFICKHKKSNDD